MRNQRPLSTFVLGAILNCGVVFAQSQGDTGVPSPAPVAAVVPEASLPTPEPEPAGQDKRIMGVLPNYRTADGTRAFVPMDARGKMRIALKDSFDYPNFVVAAALSGIYQMENENPSFGQGAKGYAHRYGTAVSDQVMGNLLAEGVMPVWLKEDPRYFRKVNGKFWPRLGYSLTRVIIAKNDHGDSCVNFAEILGNGIPASVGNLYYPDSRGFGDTVERMGTAIATDALSNVLKEFWPDVKKHLHHKTVAYQIPTHGAVAP